MSRQLGIKDCEGILTLISTGSIRRIELSKGIVEMLREEHLISIEKNGRTQFVETRKPHLVRSFVGNLVGTDNLEEYLEILRKRQDGVSPTRPESALLLNDSKAFGTDVIKGLRLNSLLPLDIIFEGKKFILDTPAGTSFEVDEQAHLDIDPTIIVVGVENYSTFMRIKDYAYLFPEDQKYLFVFRATYGESFGKLIDWLIRIPNQYLHFGDLDKGGLRIYIDQFRSRLGKRASFLIPDNYEELIRNGSTGLYNDQFAQAAPDTSKDPRIIPLLDVIEKYHKACEQEKLARPDNRLSR